MGRGRGARGRGKTAPNVPQKTPMVVQNTFGAPPKQEEVKEQKVEEKQQPPATIETAPVDESTLNETLYKTTLDIS